jgi:cell division septum initiation protein DivIVA
VATEPGAHQDERERAEVERLRARVDQLERELAERTAKAEAAVAAAQDRSYWLDRMRIDLNAVMRHRAARAAFEVLFASARALLALQRRLR